METEISTAPPASEVAGSFDAASQPTGSHQPQSGGDRLAAILAKQARGERLTRGEAGYLGSQRRRKQPAVAPAANPNPLLEPMAEAPAPAGNPLLESAGPAGPGTENPVAAVVDSVRLQKAADALLSALDIATQGVVGHQAKSIPGADKAIIARYQAAVALQPENRKLIVENSEPMVLAACKFFKCSPEGLEATLKNSGFFGGLFLHGFGVFAALKSIKESRAEAGPSQPVTQKQPATGTVVNDPPRPTGAPPVIN